MRSITVFEFEHLISDAGAHSSEVGVHVVPQAVFNWLEGACLRSADKDDVAWLKLSQKKGRRTIQFRSYVGVIRCPGGYQIEVLPKVGKAIGGGAVEARELLLEMLCCLQGFRHVQTDRAKLLARRMPLLEVFIAEFLGDVNHVVKQGLRSAYTVLQGNLPNLRGKLLMGRHLKQNLTRADRFFTEHDEFTPDRPENRLIRSALMRVLDVTSSQANQQLARELSFAFADVPLASDVKRDFLQVRLDRGMGQYADALAWARLILAEQAPLTGAGANMAPSLLFPMEAVFEAFAAKHIARQLARSFTLETQTNSLHLVHHRQQKWFRLKPDMLVRKERENQLVLDTKWKLLDAAKFNGTDKYGLAQSDFYQLQAYGQGYLDGRGDVILVYPKTDAFNAALPVFEFPKSDGLRLWVLPFCLTGKKLLLGEGGLADIFC